MQSSEHAQQTLVISKGGIRNDTFGSGALGTGQGTQETGVHSIFSAVKELLYLWVKK